MLELIGGILIGIFILVLLVVGHDVGHAIVARRKGVVVEEVGVGFPPRAWAKKLKNGILLTLNWLPLGGFVKLQGEYDSASNKGDYGAASFWQKTKILLAGVSMNFIVAVVLFTILALTGLPKALPDQFSVPSDTTILIQPVEISSVAKDSIAEKAGLEKGDKVSSFAGETIDSSSELSQLIKNKQGETVDIVYVRDGNSYTKTISIGMATDQSQGRIGISMYQRELIRATWSAPVVGIATAGQFTIATLQGLGNLLVDTFSGLFLQFSPDSNTRAEAQKDLQAAGDSVAGPIGILGTIFPAASSSGLTQLVFLTAIISLTLAVMNILPIPALDGGRWFTMAIFKIMKKPLTKSREEKIQSVGVVVLLTLILVITVLDVTKLFKQ